MLLPCDSWGRKDNSEKTEKFCNLSRRLHAQPFGAPAGKTEGRRRPGCPLEKVGHRYRADWGSPSESEAGLPLGSPTPPGTLGAGALKPFPRTLLEGLGRRRPPGRYPEVRVCSSAGQSPPRHGLGRRRGAARGQGSWGRRGAPGVIRQESRKCRPAQTLPRGHHPAAPAPSGRNLA